jgi:hypothetical protein
MRFHKLSYEINVRKKRNIPKWPMYAVSMREAIGSAATANAEGNAIPNISFESASNLKISLHLITISYSSINKNNSSSSNILLENVKLATKISDKKYKISLIFSSQNFRDTIKERFHAFAL